METKENVFINFKVEKKNIKSVIESKTDGSKVFLIVIPSGAYEDFGFWQSIKMMKRIDNENYSVSFVKENKLNIFKEQEKDEEGNWIEGDKMEIDPQELEDCFETYVGTGGAKKLDLNEALAEID